MTIEVTKSVLRNFEDFLRKDVMEVVRGMSVDRRLPSQMIRATAVSSRPSVNTGSVRPAPVKGKGKLLYFPPRRRVGI